MITVISGVNRPNSMTALVASHCVERLKAKTSEEVQYIDLAKIPHDWFSPDMYKADKQAKSLASVQDAAVLPAQKFVIVSPEYNGGMSGAFKLFIDGISIREYAANFKGKKATLIGVASGRAGNLRGCDQIASILNHVGMTTMPNKLPISQIDKLVKDGKIVDEGTIETLDKQLDAFLAF